MMNIDKIKLVIGYRNHQIIACTHHVLFQSIDVIVEVFESHQYSKCLFDRIGRSLGYLASRQAKKLSSDEYCLVSSSNLHLYNGLPCISKNLHKSKIIDFVGYLSPRGLSPIDGDESEILLASFRKEFISPKQSTLTDSPYLKWFR